VQTGFGKREVLQLQREDFAGAQAVEQHQSNDRQIAELSEASPELSDLLGRERDNDTAWLT
jgi:hypothetical protein